MPSEKASEQFVLGVYSPIGVGWAVLRILQIDKFVEMMWLHFRGSMETLVHVSNNQQKCVMGEERFGRFIAEILVFCIVGNDYLHLVLTIVGGQIDTENLLTDKINAIVFEESNLYSRVQEFLIRSVNPDA
jgi:hypothetical protein